MCDSCQVVRINGVLCHEHGCPDAWKDYYRECLWCGQRFKPEVSHQEHCEDNCYRAYHGLPFEEEEVL